MIDLNNYNLEHGGFDYNKLKSDIIENFKNVGLKDEALRQSYAAMLSKVKADKLKIEAIRLNRDSFDNMKKDGLLSERKAEKLDKQFLALLNSGLCVDDEELRFDDLVLPSLLIQSIQMQDYNRIGLLLAAGAPIVIDKNHMEKDTLCAIAQVGDLNSALIVLSFMEKPLGEHWLLGILNANVLENPKAYVLRELIARRSAELGDDYDNLMKNSIKSYRQKMNITDCDDDFIK